MCEYGDAYESNENLCKGCCRKMEYVMMALHFFMDVAVAHDGKRVGLEVAVGLDDLAVPF